MRTRKEKSSVPSMQPSKAAQERKRREQQKSRPKQFVSVNWLDIVAEEDASKEFVDARTPTELLAKKLHSTGYIYKEDNFAIVLCRDEDENNISYLALPKGVITERKNLFRTEHAPVPVTPIIRGRERKFRQSMRSKKKRKR